MATSRTETEPGRDHPEPLRPIRVPVGVATSRGSSGQSEVAVGTCREVVEGIVHVLELHFGLSAPKGKSLPDRAKELAGRVGAAWPDDKYAGEMLSGVWIVRHDDDLYVRSVRGRRGHWFLATQETHEGQIRAGAVQKDVTFVDADHDINDDIDAAYRAKYRR